MPSGFLILPDGRCLARVWSGHDGILRTVAGQLAEDSKSQALNNWILDQLPIDEDVKELGFGAWVRAKDDKVIVRRIDLRLMTKENQQLFSDAAKRARFATNTEEWLKSSIDDLAEMVEQMERGEPPLSKSDWREVVPPHGDPIGPGYP